jgi:TonB-dependent SusC/RagA subfamily outer membrane receptor
MRIVSTLIFLFVLTHVQAQSCPPKIKADYFGSDSSRQLPSSILLQKGLTGRIDGRIIVTPVRKDSVPQKNIRFIRCGLARVTNNQQPLLVVDGLISPLPTLGDLNPHDIDSIWILKDAAATAIYGSEGMNGVIIVTTKSRTYTINNMLDGSPVAGATVKFISTDKKDTLMLAANDSGVIRTNKLKRNSGYHLTVSATGYKPFKQDLRGGKYKRSDTLLLQPDIRACEEVFLSSSSNFLIGGFRCVCSGLTIISVKPAAETVVPAKPKLNIYPNPVLRGNSITLSYENNTTQASHLQLLSLDGKILCPLGPRHLFFASELCKRQHPGI